MVAERIRRSSFGGDVLNWMKLESLNRYITPGEAFGLDLPSHNPKVTNLIIKKGQN